MSVTEQPAATERSLGLAGAFVKARYRVNAVSAVSRDVVVYAAEEVRFGRPVTLKVLRDDIAADAAFVAAVKEQAGALAISAHADRGLPRVYECGLTDDGALFVALEQTKGATLREVLDARGPLDASSALRIASQVGEALETLHHDRILHGQLSPESILLVRDEDGSEHVSLMGVELTSAYRTEAGRRRREASPPPYLAPEQFERGETTGASDQYALGMLLRELLTADKSDETTLPPEVERIVTTALAREPEQRFPDISVMVNDMWAAQTGLPEPPARVRPVGVRTHALRRRRDHAPVVGLRIAAAVAAAGVIAVVVWYALSGHLASRFGASVSTPEATIVPVVRDVRPPAALPPPSVQPLPAARPLAPTVTEAPAVKNVSSEEALGHPAAAPRPAPLAEPSVLPASPAVSRPAEVPARNDQSARDGADGSGAIDWLLKRQRPQPLTPD